VSLTWVDDAETTGICMDGPRDDIDVGDTARVQVRRISDGTVRLAVIRDDENQHGIVEVWLTDAAWRDLTAVAEAPAETP
jgi:hypothetical protein